MNLQTKIPLQPQKFNQLDYSLQVLLLGSCFSENIGNKFEYYKFQNTINPFGILFHPLAIENLIARSINKAYYTAEELVNHNEVYSCFDAHSRLNDTSKDVLLERLNSTLDQTHQDLKTATLIIITLGTSWVYRHIASDKIVANCHKIPQKQFLKELLSVEKISESLEGIISLVRSVNPKASFIFTVSPVRHLKDGFVENTRSKAHLLAAVHNVVDARQQQYYFPSYEIMIDELRDYRFYNQDMLHPNALAIDYIWEAFKTVWLSKDTEVVMQEVDVIQKGMQHKPFNANSKAHQAFVIKLQNRIKNLCETYPNFNEIEFQVTSV